MQIAGRPSRLSSFHTHVAVAPVSRPIRTAPGAFDLTNEAIASGSESTTPSRTTAPVWFTTQVEVRFNDTSSPTWCSIVALHRCGASGGGPIAYGELIPRG